MKNLSLDIDDDTWQRAEAMAAAQSSTLAELVQAYLSQLSGPAKLAPDSEEFKKLERLQFSILDEVKQFSADGRLSRDEVHDRKLSR